MFNKIKSRRGETLIEVFVATMVLVVGVLAATRLFAIATINTQFTKERVIATSLAREGIEAVRIIRDTNWLRFAGERRTCWNNLDSVSCDEAGTTGAPLDPILHGQNYVAQFDSVDHRWEIDSTGLTDRLDLIDGTNPEDEFYRLSVDADGLYNIDATGTPTVYFREVYTEYLNDDQSLAMLNQTQKNILRVTVKVEWQDRGEVKEVILSTILTDYLNRKDHL